MGSMVSCSMPGCQKPHHGRGLCRPHYCEWWRSAGAENKGPRPGSRREFFERALQLETDDCILWPGSVKNGYGLINDHGATRRVHVLALERSAPKPGPHHEAAHSCGRSTCFNPRHLRWATPSENAADKVLHGTSRKGVPRRRYHSVSPDEVHEMRERHAQGESVSSLARAFASSRTHISRLVGRA